MAEEKYGKLILTTAMKTILFVVGFLCLVMSYIFVISPTTLSGVYSKLGMGRAEIATFEAAYEKSGNNSDLYNLIQKCLEKENYEKSRIYIEELLAKDDFKEFANKVNAVSVENATKQQVAHVVDLESYLEGHLLVSLYKLGEKNKARDMALEDLNQTENKYSFLLGNYYDVVLLDLSLTVAEAQRHLMDIYLATGVQDKINAKIDACEHNYETTPKLAIATLYSKIKIMNYKRNLMKFAGESLTGINKDIDDLQVEFDHLLK